MPGMTAELETAPADAEIVNPATAPAVRLACERCGTPTLLRPGGLCADCIAGIGLADDRTEYGAWRERVSDEVVAGSPATR